MRLRDQRAPAYDVEQALGPQLPLFRTRTGWTAFMRMEGTLRANLIAAIASTRRLRGSNIHRDTIDYWERLLDYGRHNAGQPSCEPVTELLAQLEDELSQVKRA